jgi:hypothetical protein
MKTHLFKKLTISALIAFLFISCEVDGDVNGNNNNNTNELDSFKNLEVTDTFDWKTSSDYTINFNGIPVTSQVKRPLIIKTGSGEVIRSMNISLSDNFSIDLRVPSKEQNLMLSWGTYQKELLLERNLFIDFTFLEPNTDEE